MPLAMSSPSCMLLLISPSSMATLSLKIILPTISVISILASLEDVFPKEPVNVNVPLFGFGTIDRSLFLFVTCFTPTLLDCFKWLTKAQHPDIAGPLVLGVSPQQQGPSQTPTIQTPTVPGQRDDKRIGVPGVAGNKPGQTGTPYISTHWKYIVEVAGPVKVNWYGVQVPPTRPPV